MASRPPDPPALWIIAGANGSGKSTAYERSTIEAPAGGIWFINPDALAARIADHEHLPLTPDANLEAVRRIERWLHASVDAHQTVGWKPFFPPPSTASWWSAPASRASASA